MSDLNLLLMGCAVTFIGVGGAYVYLREAFEASERIRESEVSTHRRDPSVREVA